MIRVAEPLGMFFLQSGTQSTLEENLFKFQFRPMIGSLRSTCTFYRLKDMELEVSRYTYRLGSTKGMAEASKSYPCLGGTYIPPPHSFCLPCFYTFSPTFHPTHIHTKVDFSRE